MFMWMEISIAAIILGVCFITTFFSFRTPGILFRISAALSWVTLIIFVLNVSGGSYTFALDNPWVICGFLAVFSMIFAILILYMGKEIDQYGRFVKKEKDLRSEEQKRQESYRMELKKITHRR